MDPHKRSATVEVIDERGRRLAAGRYGTDKAGYAALLVAGRKFSDRIWAVEGCNGIGRHLAHRLVHDGETVLDVPAKAAGKTSMEAMRALKRRLSNVVYQRMLADSNAAKQRARVGTWGRLCNPA
jgi:hypothetical protein